MKETKRNSYIKSNTLFYSLSVIMLGFVMGIVSKHFDSISIIGEITTELGIWVLIATIVARYSKTPVYAGLNTTLFLLSMLVSYYVYSYLVLDFFPKQYVIGWLVVSLISFVPGMIVWYSRKEDIIGIIICSLPVSLLFAIGYPAFYTHKIVLILTLVYGLALNVVLPKTMRDKFLVFLTSIILAYIINYFQLISLLPW